MIHNNNANSALTFSRSGVDDLDAVYSCMLACGWKYLRSELERLLRLASDVRVCWAQTEGGRIVVGMGIRTTVTEKRVGCQQSLSLIGMMITMPRYRRRGIAKQIFAALAPPDANAALVATEIGSKVYLKQSFALASTSAVAASRPMFEHPDAVALSAELHQHGHISNNNTVEEAEVATIVALDTEIRGIDRTHVLEAIAAGTADVTTRIVVARDSSGRVRGYAVMSCYPCGKMFLGPVAAATSGDAVAMLEALLVLDSSGTTGVKPVSVFLSGSPLAAELATKLQALGFVHKATLMAMDRYTGDRGKLHMVGKDLEYAAMASPAWG